MENRIFPSIRGQGGQVVPIRLELHGCLAPNDANRDSCFVNAN